MKTLAQSLIIFASLLLGLFFTPLAQAGLVAQTITFSLPITVIGFNQHSYVISPAPTASSGLAVTLTSTTPSICTVTGTTVNFVNIGTCTIAANQGGNLFVYAAAPQVTRSFNILGVDNPVFPQPADQSLSSAPVTVQAYSIYGLSFSYASLTPSTCYVNGNLVFMMSVGTCTVQASHPQTATVMAASVQTSFNITASVSSANTATPMTAAGANFSCSLNADGAVSCWGANNSGQLGNGSTIASSTPVAVAGLMNGVSAISLGSGHACALLNSGTVRCWGNNAAGQLGNGSFINSALPVTVSGLSGVTAISAGKNGSHTCAIASGAATCWGQNSDGQLGNNTTTNANTPVAVSGLSSGVVAISAGGKHSCAVTTGGVTQCWGNNDYGQLGNNNAGTPSYVPVATNTLTSGVQSISAGYDFNCALKNDGSVYCWGSNGLGQSALGNTPAASIPTLTPLHSGIVAIASGGGFACALNNLGAVQCWGNNDAGQLGNGSNISSTLPTATTLNAGVTQLSAGSGHACAVMLTGHVNCWGGNPQGGLGNGNSTASNAPNLVLGNAGRGSLNLNAVTPTVASQANALHTCALSSTGNVQCWGYNFYGQLGNGNISNTPLPVTVKDASGTGSLSNIVALTAGNVHTCALTSTGNVQCWGYNSSGQLGNGNTSNTPLPVTVKDASGSTPLAIAGSGSLSQSITFPALSFTSLDMTNAATPIANLPTASSGLPVTLSSLTPTVCTVTSNSVTPVTPGVCTLAANQAGSAVYASAPQVTRSFNVFLANDLITLGSIADQPLSSTPISLSAYAASGLTLTTSSLTPSVCAVAGSSVNLLATGLCTLQASHAANGVYAAISAQTSFNITPPVQVVADGDAPLPAWMLWLLGSGLMGAMFRKRATP